MPGPAVAVALDATLEADTELELGPDAAGLPDEQATVNPATRHSEVETKVILRVLMVTFRGFGASSSVTWRKGAIWARCAVYARGATCRIIYKLMSECKTSSR